VHGLQLLHTLLSKACSQIHSIRLKALEAAVASLLINNKLTLVQIGRNLSGKARIKNKIKKVDRLIGNKHLYQERTEIYRSLCCKLIAPSSRPIILIDWSGVTHCGAFHMIRACLPINGRTITLYEEVYPESEKDSPKSNRIFLRNLAMILPENCRPIIVTDAGFRNPWFKEVLRLGWDFVGRIRGNAHVQKISENTWKFCKVLYKAATLNAKYLGKFQLAKSNPIACEMHMIKGRPKYRKKKNLKGHYVRCSSSLKHAKRNKEPWLIATSLTKISTKKIIKFYKLRMSIEQGFRDIKNLRHGFCFRETRSTTQKRLSILLLIGALATFIVCVYGHVTRVLKLHYHYQTNSIKNRTVLSWFFMGVTVLKENRRFPRKILNKVFRQEIIAKVLYA